VKLFGVSSQSVVVVTFNMLLLSGKSFFKSQKELKLIFLLASVAWPIWLFIYLLSAKTNFWIELWSKMRQKH